MRGFLCPSLETDLQELLHYHHPAIAKGLGEQRMDGSYTGHVGCGSSNPIEHLLGHY